MGLLDETIGRIHPLDREAMYKAQKRWDDLYVGVGDLGKLEEMVIQYAGVTGEVLPEIPKCCMVVACADHGVYRQKVSAYPQSTTVGMVKSYVDVKGASANALAHYCGAHMVVVDMGINADMSDVPGLLHRKIAFGTKDITEGAAMSRAEAIHAIEAGIEIAENKIKEEKKDILEISSKSKDELGIALSAFNLMITTKKLGKTFSVECAFQSSKVFEGNIQYLDLLEKTSREAKKDTRLKESGNVIGFNFYNQFWETTPLTAFYDWLYINALNSKPEYHEQLLKYEAFTDIEFNPQKSINCQAKSVALFCALYKRNLLEDALISQESFLTLYKDYDIGNSYKKNSTRSQISLIG